MIMGHCPQAKGIWSKNADKFKGTPEMYIQSAPNNSNETHAFMGLGRVGRFGQH